jgi:peptide chain release factor subunit 1
MSPALATARRLLERTGGHPVVSLFFDLDPAQFATAPARATQTRSLIDEADRAARGDTTLNHEDRVVLAEDLKELETYLQSDELPVSGVRSLAVFRSGQDDLFETVALSEAMPPKVVIARTAYIEPLVTGPADGRWCVALVSRRNAKILVGPVEHIRGLESVTDDVHGQSHAGGWSQANLERSYDDEADHHLRHVAQEVYHAWQREPFERLILGGPLQDVDRFAELLHNDLRRALSPARLSLEAETATVPEVQAALLPLYDQERSAARAAALTELGTRVDRKSGATIGLADTLAALAERRVETLVLALDFAAHGGRCSSCGLLYPQDSGPCPVDGTELEPVADMREAAIEAAVLQDAGVVVIGEGSEIPPEVLLRGGGIAALLRF